MTMRLPRRSSSEIGTSQGNQRAPGSVGTNRTLECPRVGQLGVRAVATHGAEIGCCHVCGATVAVAVFVEVDWFDAGGYALVDTGVTYDVDERCQCVTGEHHCIGPST
jgi:hypothetical protein